MVKFLIIRFSSIGDIVLTTPVIRNLKNQVEGAQIHYLTKKSFLPVLEDNPYIDKIHLFEGNLQKVIDELKAINIDFIIDLHNNLRSRRVKIALNKVSYSFSKLNVQKWILVNFKINRLPNVHIVDRYMETLSTFNVKNDKRGLDFFINSANEMDISRLPVKYQSGYVVVVIGAKHFTKQLPEERLIALVKKLNSPVLLLGGKEDFERGENISRAVGEDVINYCGKLSLQQSASLVKQAKVIVTHDTGLMHIASAFGKTIISIWGSTVPEFGMYPYLPGEDSAIFQVQKLRCRPCSKIGFDKCPLKHFKCMNEMDLDAIAIKANQLL